MSTIAFTSLVAPVHRNIPIIVNDVFSTDLWTGDGVSQTISNGVNLSGSGGAVLIKDRDSGAVAPRMFDTERGVANTLYPSGAFIEAADPVSLTAFNTSGYSLGSSGGVNTNTNAIVGWTFRKAPGFFDVVEYTGTGANQTIPIPLLGAVPGMYIVKRTDASSDWRVYHRQAGGGISPASYWLEFNSTAAESGTGIVWQNTDPTDTDFYIGTEAEVNASGGNYIAYLFGHDTGPDGVVQCGSYAGNGSASGPTINLGWNPQFLMIKASGTTGSWYIQDTARGIPAGNDFELQANDNSGEGSGNDRVDLTGSGFQIATTSVAYNSSGDDYIYVAIKAE